MKIKGIGNTGLLRDIKFNVILLVLTAFFALPVFYLITSAFMTRVEVWSAAILPAKFQSELKLATALVAAVPILLILLVFSKQVFSAMSKTGGLKY